MPSLSELLAALSDPRMRHAAVVHLPVALGLLGLAPVALLALRRGRDDALRLWTVGLYAALVVAALVAVDTGADARVELGSASLEARRVVAEHEWMARRVWLLALVTALSAASTGLVSRPVIARLALGLCMGSALTTAGWVGLVGHHGGTAVYSHGVGLPARTPEEPVRETDPRRAHFAERVRPLLERTCAGCHGPGEFASGGLDLTSIEGLLRGGERGAAVVPGAPGESLLYRAVSGTEPSLRMPMGGAELTQEELRDLWTWIEAGAVWGE